MIRTAIIVVMALLAACVAQGNVTLIDDRIEAQQITEVRFDVPEGCVITGLGFRAHEDNLTTMLCRYHKISPEGKLVEPKEARVGSEPDHACEATVLLPDGYVAVGFGGRGAPEWDITTLRIWARPLNPDGTLGEIKIFNDGFAPDHHCEREIVLKETDRVLTGAGLRFHYHDMIGIYGRSNKIANIDKKALSKKLAPTGGPMVLDATAGRVGNNVFPNIRLLDYASQLTQAAIAGDTSYTLHTGEDKSKISGTINELNLKAVEILSKDPLMSADKVWEQITAERFGAPAAPKAREALQWTASINDLIFKALGINLLEDNGKLVTVDEARSRLEMMSGDEAIAAVAQSLLFPNSDTMDATNREKEAVRWMLRQAIPAAEAANTTLSSAATKELVEGMTKLQEAEKFWDAATRAFVYTQIYHLDGAPQTRTSAENALKDLKTVADEVTMFTGADEFIASAKQALEDSEKNGPLAVAFAEINDLIAKGKAEEATQALATVINDKKFSEHLNKRWETIGEVGTKLTAVWTAKPNIRVLWGGDGRWNLEKTNGKWSFVNKDGSPCFYFDAVGDKLDPPADYVLSFEYYDEGTGTINIHYDSDYEQDRQYHPADPIKKTDTKTWKKAQVTFTKALFSGSENMEADMRILGGTPLRVRNVELKAK